MTTKNLNNCSLFDKATIWLLLLTQILKTYGYVSYWNFANILTYLFAVIFIVRCFFSPTKYKVDMPRELIVFFIYWIVVYIYNNIHNNPIPSNIILLIFSFVLFWGVVTTNQLPRLIKYYRIIGACCILFFFLQETAYYTIGQRFLGIIPFFPIALNSVDDIDSYIMKNVSGFRSSSFFSEPAYFAQYLIPLLAIELFYDKSKRHYLYSLIIFVAILLANTGSGLVGLLGILITYMFNFHNVIKKQNYLLTIFLFLLIIIVGCFCMNTSMGESLIDRKTELSFDYEGGSRSGFMRLYRGLYVFAEYSFSEKLFGNDNSNEMNNHMMHSSAYDTFGDNNDTFFNGYQYCLLRTGFVGLLLMIILIYNTLRHNSICGKCITLSFGCLMAVEAMFFGNNMILFLIISYRLKQLNSINNENRLHFKYRLC